MEKQLQPKLRFPEFSGDWNISRLENLFEQFKSGNTITAKSIFESGTYPVFGGNGLRGYCENYTHDGKYFLIGRQGALCGNINKYNGKAFVSEHAIVCISNNDNDTEFLAQRLEYLNLNRLSESSAQPGLAVNKLLRLKITTPSLLEQQKIADYLTTIDKKIELLEEKKTELSRYKKAMMQKLFAQEIRFKDENGNDYPEWEEKRLGDVFNSFNGLTGKTKENFGFGKPYIKYTQVFGSSKIDVGGFDLVEITANDKQNQAQYGDAFFTVSSETPHEVGMSSVLLDEVDEVYLNSFCFGIRPKSKNLNPHYYRYFFRSKNFRKEVVKLAQGSTRYNMSKVEFMKINIEIPSLPEQQKIADFLFSIDESITKVEEQIEETQNFKKAMLQQLFV